MQSQGKPNLAQRQDGSRSLTREEQLDLDKRHLQHFLQQQEKTLIQAWKGSVDPKDLTMIVMAAVTENPRLLQCSARSIIRALVTAARCKIRPGHMGRGYLVPRKNKNTGQQECCFDPGYKGMIDIAKRTGEVKKIVANVVRKEDYFKHDAANDHIEHEPNYDKQDSEIICAYSTATLKDGDKQNEVVSRSDLNKIRNASMAKSDTAPWGQWEGEMSRKSAVRRLCKYLPVDDAMEAVIAASDNAAGVGIEVFHSADQEDAIAEITEEPIQQAVKRVSAADARGSVSREESEPPARQEPEQARAANPPAPPPPARQEPDPPPVNRRTAAQTQAAVQSQAVASAQETTNRRRRGSTASEGKPRRAAPVETKPAPKPEPDPPFDGDFDEGESVDDSREPGADEHEGQGSLIK